MSRPSATLGSGMPPRLRYPEFAPEGIAALRATEHYLNAATALPAVLLELIRLRVSLVNGCSFCTGHHTEELRKHNEPETRIAALGRWQDSDAFTPRERAALAWADSVTEISTRHASDPAYAAVSTWFHEKDLVDLTLAVASINAWNRLSIAFGAQWDPHRAKLPPTSASPNGSNSTAGNAVEGPSSTTAAASPAQTTPAHEDAPTQDVVDSDGGKVAQE